MLFHSIVFTLWRQTYYKKACYELFLKISKYPKFKQHSYSQVFPPFFQWICSFIKGLEWTLSWVKCVIIKCVRFPVKRISHADTHSSIPFFPPLYVRILEKWYKYINEHMYCICINIYMEVHAVFMSRKYMYMYRNYGTQFSDGFVSRETFNII